MGREGTAQIRKNVFFSAENPGKMCWPLYCGVAVVHGIQGVFSEVAEVIDFSTTQLLFSPGAARCPVHPVRCCAKNGFYASHQIRPVPVWRCSGWFIRHCAAQSPFPSRTTLSLTLRIRLHAKHPIRPGGRIGCCRSASYFSVVCSLSSGCA